MYCIYRITNLINGKNNPMFGKPCPNKGTHWFNNGKIEIRIEKCPEGFVLGRLKK